MKQHDFNDRILEEVAHRPWAMPDSPWIMTQTWHDLLFAHWPVNRRQLAARIPHALELDTFEGEAWLGIVPFHMTNVAPRAVPALPWVSAFPELNVRTYVTVDGKPGVYFFSLDAGNPLAVGVGRRMFHLPYFLASMKVHNRDGVIDYTSRRSEHGAANVELIVSYEPSGLPFRATEGTLEYFLTERYCLYTVNGRNEVSRVNIHHPPWPLQLAKATLHVNTMTEPIGIQLLPLASRLHFAKRQDTVAWLPEAL